MVKLAASLLVILVATAIARRLPTLGGLIATMPLTGLLVLVWVNIENRGEPAIMEGFARGALFGIIPSLAFFLVVWILFRRGFHLLPAVGAGMAAWLAGALLHRILLR